MVELFGWISTAAFAICAVPQAYKAYRDGHSDGLAAGLLWLWMIGEITGMCYGVGLKELPLILNYSANAILVGFVLRYKIYPRR